MTAELGLLYVALLLVVVTLFHRLRHRDPPNLPPQDHPITPQDWRKP